jgi:hypothetical protein
MGKMMKGGFFLLLAIGVLIAVYFVFRAMSSFMQGYSWHEMDWDQDGSTSIGDVIDASDIGKREVILNGKKCIEYYAYKDGLPVKTICQK